MSNKYLGYERVNVDKDVYLFKTDFAFIAELKTIAGIDAMMIFEGYQKGEADPYHVRDIMQCSILKKNGVDIPENEKKELCENLITLKGLQECWLLTQYLLSYCMIGDIKKSEMRKAQTTEKLLKRLTPFRSQSFRNHVLLWGYHLLIFGICACISSRLF